MKSVKKKEKSEKLKNQQIAQKELERKKQEFNKKLEEKIKSKLEIKKQSSKKGYTKTIIAGLILGLIGFLVFFFVSRKLVTSLIGFIVTAGLFFVYVFLKSTLSKYTMIKKIESQFPDFLQLMASNLRAGMTIDRAMLLSARPEFEPLDKEILSVGKDIATGKSIESSLLAMSKRINSEKIKKIVSLIISGIRSGGNLAILLEETAVNMRQREFVEKRASSNVLMYVIFIFIAASIGAPILFALSSILIETLTAMLSSVGTIEPPASAGIAVPFTLSAVSISVVFIKWFSVLFLITINILASLVLGLVSKGEEREGFKYTIPMVALSLTVFFLVRIFSSGFVEGLFG